MLDETPFSELVEALQPGATGKTIVELLDGKANRTTALGWKAGRRHAPKWALDLLSSKAQAEADRLFEIVRQTHAVPERPGLKAGARNLAAYLAARR